MATTPPAQIRLSSPQTPSTPLHGARYDDDYSPKRFSARLREKANTNSQEEKLDVRLATTPNQSPHKISGQRPLELSPGRTPKRKFIQRTQLFSPPSPDSEPRKRQSAHSQAGRQQSYLSSNTIMSEAMLPTPVKTPKKQQYSKSSLAARALFQDEMAPSPRRSRKAKRFNGFSLENVGANGGDREGGIQIFTDSRDHVPEADETLENPFLDHGRQVTSSRRIDGTSKRRRVSNEKPKDPQVEEAILNDEGMVYVFRGRKVYRRFDDAGEEEEEIDAQDLGLLRNARDSTLLSKPMKTLTRKSIRPTRLFQTEQQKRDREIEKEEEASTDIEDVTNSELNTSPIAATKLANAKVEKTDEPELNVTPAVGGNIDTRSKKRSPFDTWQRLKGSATAQRATRGRKRAAPEEFDEQAA